MAFIEMNFGSGGGSAGSIKLKYIKTAGTVGSARQGFSFSLPDGDDTDLFLVMYDNGSGNSTPPVSAGENIVSWVITIDNIMGMFTRDFSLKVNASSTATFSRNADGTYTIGNGYAANLKLNIYQVVYE